MEKTSINFFLHKPIFWAQNNNETNQIAGGENHIQIKYKSVFTLFLLSICVQRPIFSVCNQYPKIKKNLKLVLSKKNRGSGGDPGGEEGEGGSNERT